MPYTAAHNVLQIIGDITSEAELELWTTSLRFGEGTALMGQPIPVVNDPAPGVVLDDIQTDLTAWWNGISAFIGTSVRMTAFKFNAVDVLGRYIDQGKTYVRDLTTPLVGTGGPVLPAQIATAVTFRTDANRGLASSGRMYLPPFGTHCVSAGGRLSDLIAVDVTRVTAELLTSLSNWPGAEASADYGRVCVMSKVREGATRRVNRVDTGDLFDTIRSRRESLREHRTPPQLVTS